MDNKELDKIRAEFEAWWIDYADPNVGSVEYMTKRQAAIAAWQAAKGLDAYEMVRLRRLVDTLGMDGSARRSDGVVRGLLFTALGQAADKVERAALARAGSAAPAGQQAKTGCDGTGQASNDMPCLGCDNCPEFFSAKEAIAAGQQAEPVRRRTVTNPDGSTTTYISEYEHSLEMDLAECRDLFEMPESGELHDLWSEACSEPRAVAAYVKAQFAAIKALAAPTAAEGPSLGADEMMRLRRLMRALGMPEKSWSDSQACECLCTILGEASRYIERAAPLPTKEGAGEVDAVVEANRKLLLDRSRVGIRKYGVTLADAGLSRTELAQHALEEALDLANYLQTIIQTDAAIAAKPKDTTDTRRDA